MKIKTKWVASFYPIFLIGAQALLETWHGQWSSLEHRVMWTGAMLLLTCIMLIIVQPWKEDAQR